MKSNGSRTKSDNPKYQYGFKSLGIDTKTAEKIDKISKVTGKDKYRIVHDAIDLYLRKNKIVIPE